MFNPELNVKLEPTFEVCRLTECLLVMLTCVVNFQHALIYRRTASKSQLLIFHLSLGAKFTTRKGKTIQRYW